MWVRNRTVPASTPNARSRFERLKRSVSKKINSERNSEKKARDGARQWCVDRSAVDRNLLKPFSQSSNPTSSTARSLLSALSNQLGPPQASLITQGSKCCTVPCKSLILPRISPLSACIFAVAVRSQAALHHAVFGPLPVILFQTCPPCLPTQGLNTFTLPALFVASL